MSATENLSSYDDITSDELFDSFMEVIVSVEQSEKYRNCNHTDLSDNVYEVIDNFDINASAGDVYNGDNVVNIEAFQRQLSDSNFPDSQIMPLMVKLSGEPIYAMCDETSRNSDDAENMITDLGDLHFTHTDSSVVHMDSNSDEHPYATVSPQYNLLVSTCDENQGEVARNEDFKNGSKETVVGNCISKSHEQNSERFLDNSVNSFMVDEVNPSLHTIYAVVNKETKRNSNHSYTSPDMEIKPDRGDSQIMESETKENTMGLYAVVDKRKQSNSDHLSTDLCSEMKKIDSDDGIQGEKKDNYGENVTTSTNEYVTIEGCQLQFNSRDSAIDRKLDIPKSPDIVYNAEQIAYGFQKCHKENEGMFEASIKSIEKRNSALAYAPKAGKDKKNFFGFGKWKSTEDNSKSSSNSSCFINDHGREKSHSPTIEKKDIPVVYSGYLFKQGGSGFTPKNWRLRWFQLKKDNCLYYYKSEQDHIPNGAVMLLRYSVTRALEVNKRFAFKVTKGGARTYYFAANSEEEMKKWMVYLSDGAKYASSDHTAIPDCSLKNVSIPAISITEPDCHGFMSKQGNIHKSWKKRYCVLKYGCLFYYESMTDKVAIGVFKLHRYTINRCDSIRNGIETIPPVRKMRTYYFYTDSETDTIRWIDAMKRSISSF